MFDRFVITGDGEMKKELVHYADRLGLNSVTEFTGWEKDLMRLYSDLDIVCLTSLNEGTPVSLIEAMASARPVVATDVGGVNELVANNHKSIVQPDNFQICERGVLVRSCDAKAFAEGLRVLAEDEKLRDKMGSNAREFVRNRFSKERLLSDIENLYSSLLERRQ